VRLSLNVRLKNELLTSTRYVTKFTMKVHPIGQARVFQTPLRLQAESSSSLDLGRNSLLRRHRAETILNATQEFTENYNDPNASIIVTGEIAIGSLLETFIVFFFYGGPTPPDGVFDNFNAIPTLTDGVQTQSYYDFVIPLS
jgi:hypothetical protein